MLVELSVEQQYVISLGVGGLDVFVLCGGVGSIEVHHIAFGVGLLGLHQCAVFLGGVVVALGVFEQEEF